MKTAIEKLVAEREHVSFAELSRKIEGFSGELGLFRPPYDNIVLWPAISQEGVAAISSLLKEGKIYMHPCTVLIYHVDGQVPSFPIAKGAKPYKTMRWFPVVFCTHPYKQPTKLGKKTVSGRNKNG